jgi:hypothetical protein
MDNSRRYFGRAIDAQNFVAIPQVEVPFMNGGNLVEMRLYHLDLGGRVYACFKNQDHSMHVLIFYYDRERTVGVMVNC